MKMLREDGAQERARNVDGAMVLVMSIQESIQEMTRRIVERFDPDQVILFGSHARGNAGPDSDVDLLVVVPSAQSRRSKQLDIRLALHDIRVPKDVIVTTSADFAWRRNIVGTIEEPASREGKTLYVRQ